MEKIIHNEKLFENTTGPENPYKPSKDVEPTEVEEI